MKLLSFGRRARASQREEIERQAAAELGLSGPAATAQASGSAPAAEPADMHQPPPDDSPAYAEMDAEMDAVDRGTVDTDAALVDPDVSPDGGPGAASRPTEVAPPTAMDAAAPPAGDKPPAWSAFSDGADWKVAPMASAAPAPTAAGETKPKPRAQTKTKAARGAKTGKGRKAPSRAR